MQRWLDTQLQHRNLFYLVRDYFFTKYATSSRGVSQVDELEQTLVQLRDRQTTIEVLRKSTVPSHILQPRLELLQADEGLLREKLFQQRRARTITLKEQRVQHETLEQQLTIVARIEDEMERVQKQTTEKQKEMYRLKREVALEMQSLYELFKEWDTAPADEMIERAYEIHQHQMVMYEWFTQLTSVEEEWEVLQRESNRWLERLKPYEVLLTTKRQEQLSHSIQEWKVTDESDPVWVCWQHYQLAFDLECAELKELLITKTEAATFSMEYHDTLRSGVDRLYDLVLYTLMEKNHQMHRVGRVMMETNQHTELRDAPSPKNWKRWEVWPEPQAASPRVQVVNGLGTVKGL